MPVTTLNPQHLWRADEVIEAEAGSTVASGFAAIDAVLPGGGWPQGQLVELLVDSPGLGELSLLAPALQSALNTSASKNLRCQCLPRVRCCCARCTCHSTRTCAGE